MNEALSVRWIRPRVGRPTWLLSCESRLNHAEALHA